MCDPARIKALSYLDIRQDSYPGYRDPQPLVFMGRFVADSGTQGFARKLPKLYEA
jgi:hypothetical protein